MLDYATLLQERFGLSGFRTGQKEIIEAILKQKDVLAVLPTGGGKSLCYQLPAVATNQLVVVVSPLIALMKDQVGSLQALGLPAGALHSGQPDEEKRQVFRQIEGGGAFILYLSPERVQKPGFRTWIQNRPIALFAIDEAHCVSEWGHDFREEYSQLKELKAWRPDVPTLALTASATPLVLADIAKNLNLKKPERHVHGFYRPNLYYQVESCADADEKMRFIQSAIEATPEGRILVYCGTRKKTEEVAEELQRQFQGVEFYHAGLSADLRTRVQKEYAAGEHRILVATNAFGMGIDQPDVRLVIHHQLPANIDSLYQEMGRAGRDGQPSTCLLLYAKADKGLQNYFIINSTAPKRIKDTRWKNLEALIAYAEGGECRHSEILAYYKDAQKLESCGHCDVCEPNSDRRMKRPVWPVANKKEGSKVLRKSSRQKAVEVVLNERQREAFQVLRAWRLKKAQELEQPAFVILSDKALRDLVVKKPQTVSELENVYGFGEFKIEQFGREVITELNQVEGL